MWHSWDLARGASPGHVDVPLLVGVSFGYSSTMTRSCLECPPPTNRFLEDVRKSGLWSSKIPLPYPWVPYRRVGSLRFVHSCYMSSPSPLEHFRSCRCISHASTPLNSVFQILSFKVTPKTFLSVLRWQSTVISLSLPEPVMKAK
jgi:hypothetical protein